MYSCFRQTPIWRMASECPQEPRSGSRDLLTACMSGSWGNVAALLEAGANLFCSDKGGRNVLHFACMGNNVEVAENIVKRKKEGAHLLICEESRDVATPLGMACSQSRLELVKLFVNHGPNQVGLLALHRACKEGKREVVRCLLSLEQNIDINAEDYVTRDSPLHVAIANGCIEVVKMLLDKNADVNHTNRYGYTPLHQAVLKKNPYILHRILKRDPDLNVADTNGDSPLHLACMTNSQLAVDALIDHKATLDTENRDGYTPLHIACINGRTHIIEMLFTAGANINFSGRIKKTPLYVACQHGQDDVVSLLLEGKADVTQGLSPIQIAAQKKYLTIVDMLMKHIDSQSVPEKVRTRLLSGMQVPTSGELS
ncbi:hypothetical protein ACOMHN_059605 [Nucella lapillus]